MPDRDPPFDPETSLAGLARMLAAKGLAQEASAIANASAKIALDDFDNWNGGTYTWDLQVMIPFDQFFGLSEEQREGIVKHGVDVLRHMIKDKNHSSIVSLSAQLPVDKAWRMKIRTEAIKKFSAEAEGDAWYEHLEIPKAWRFTSLGLDVPVAAVREFHDIACQVAAKSSDEHSALETFKSEFGGSGYSSSASWAATDLFPLMQKLATRPVDFIDAFWRATIRMSTLTDAAPTYQHVNAILARHSVPFIIDPPSLVQSNVGRGGDSGEQAASVVPPSEDLDAVPRPSPVAIPFGTYKLVRLLSGGGMAEAWEATSTDGQRAFLKRVRAQAKFDASALNREAAIYQRLQQITAANAHLLSVREWVRDGEWVALVTEFADGGDLAASIAKSGPMSTTGAVSVMRDVLTALSTFHQNGIVHRDIKPGNVVWTRGSWKIADFGIAKNIKHVVTNYTFQSVGTQAYMAPEQKEGAEAAPPMDVFAAGKLLCFLLTGNTDVDAVPYPRAAVVVRACTTPNPAERPTAPDLLTMLNNLTT